MPCATPTPMILGIVPARGDDLSSQYLHQQGAQQGVLKHLNISDEDKGMTALP